MALNINKYVTVREPSKVLCHFSDAIGIPLESWYFRICLHERENLDKSIPDQNIEIIYSEVDTWPEFFSEKFKYKLL